MINFLKNLLSALRPARGYAHNLPRLGAPWWLAVVMLKLVVRALLFPLTFRQVKSVRRMQELKPDLDEIRVQYKDDPKNSSKSR